MRIPELKSQYIWAILLAIFTVAIIHPIEIPIPMSKATLDVYNMIENLPEGSIVAVGGAYVFAFDLESSASMIACLKQMARNHLRVVFVPLSVEAVQMHKYCIDMARVDEKYGGPWKYGRDYVQLPYMPGMDAALVAFLTDVHSAVATDVYGTPLDELPLMRDLHSYKDISLWICIHWAFPMIVRYVTSERGIPSVYFAQAAAYASYAPYMAMYPGKVFMTLGFLGGAQYEKLVGIKGLGYAAMNAYSFLVIAFVIFVILGNITMLTRLGEEEE